MEKNWVKFTAIITISAIVGSACAALSYKNQPQPDILFVDALASKNKVSCEKMTELPAIYRCKMPEGVVCYVVQTGISCLPLETKNSSLSDWGLGPAIVKRQSLLTNPNQLLIL